MKKSVIAGIVIMSIATCFTACGNSKEEQGDSMAKASNGTVVMESNGKVTGQVVGEELVMPEEGTDSTVIANGTAVVVQK